MKALYSHYKQIIGNTLLGIFIGIAVGIVDAIFGRVLLTVTEIRIHNVAKVLPFLPFAGLLIMFLYRTYSKESIRGMTLVFEAGHGDTNRIPKMLVPLIMISTWLTHLFGGSAGREGVAVQIGATIAHTTGRLFKLPNNSKVLLIAGMAAGFAGLFQTPLTATFFAMEVLIAGSVLYEALLPALAASFVSSYTSHMLGLEKFSVVLPDSMSMSGGILFKLVLVGIICGITGGVFAQLLSYSKQWFASKIENPMWRIFLMGIMISALCMLLHMGRYSGLGTNLITASFSGNTIYGYDWILKMILTIVTLSAGYQGGEVTPLFAIGSSLGIMLAYGLGLPPIWIAALGYAAVFGSGTNTLLAPILIGVEVFGTKELWIFVVVCSVAYVCNGNRTIYGLQKNREF